MPVLKLGRMNTYLLYWSIMSLYRGSFHLSIGLDEASCAGQKVTSGISPRAD